MSLFVLEYRFPEHAEERLAVRPRHRAYLDELKASGNLVAAGPWADDSGALLIYAAENEAELERLLADDPYVVEDVFGERVLREWRPIVGGEVEIP
jgi:uncharacterized protein